MDNERRATWPRTSQLARRLAAINEQRLAVGLGLAIPILGLLGAGFIANSNFARDEWNGALVIGGLHMRGFNLDGELNIPAAFSALLLLAACAVGLVAAATSRGTSISARFVVPVAALLGYMAIDEAATLHERIERWTGVDWQLIYLPVFLLAGVAGLLLVRELWGRGPAAGLLLAGGASWVISQVIERIQWDGDRLLYPWTIVPEEMLEMIGSTLFLLAFLATLRGVVRMRDESRTAAP